MQSWTASIIRKWRPYLTWTSVLRMIAHEIRDGRHQVGRVDRINLTLAKPFSAALTLREYGTDIGTLREVLIDEVYSPVVEHIPDCSTVVDLGANIGMASLYFAWRYPHARIVAVEPHPETFEILQKNVQANVIDGRCELRQAAIWSADRDIAYTERRESSYAAVVTGEDMNGANGITAAITMPRLMSDHRLQRIDLLKIDIEGAEVELFRDDTTWLENVSALAIEFHDDSRARSGFDSVMKRHGFSVVISNPHTVLLTRGNS